jgi:hypothetical protein
MGVDVNDEIRLSAVEIIRGQQFQTRCPKFIAQRQPRPA